MPLSRLQTAANNTSGGSTATVSTTFGAAISANSIVIAFCAYQTDSNSGTVTDGAGNVYTPDTPYTNSADGWVIQAFYFIYTTAPSSSALTLALANGVASKGIFAIEYAALDHAYIPQIIWNRQVGPGTGVGALVTGNATPAVQPFLQLEFGMSFTGSSGGIPAQASGFLSAGGAWTFAGGTGNCARGADKRITALGALQATMTAGVGTDTYYVGQVIWGEAGAGNTFKTNPMGLSYTSVANLSQYYFPGALIITGPDNRYDPAFQAARKAGAEVLAYLDFIERPDSSLGPISNGFYMGNPAVVPLWPLYSPNTIQRVNFANNHMTDITPGSAWIVSSLAYSANLMREGLVDGIFMDVTGDRLYSALADWADWSTAEQNDWTDFNVSLVSNLDALRRAINPGFIIINNNVWNGRGDGRGTPAEQYVDGICLEHHPSTSLANTAYAQHAYSNLGHRRMVSIATTTAGEVTAWASVQGITHVSNQAHYTTIGTPPPLTFSDTRISGTRGLFLAGVGSGLLKSQ